MAETGNCPQQATYHDQFLDAVLNDLPLAQEVTAHLAVCQHCSSELARLRSLQHALLVRLYRSKCPSVEQINKYAAHFLSETDRAAIQAHVQYCPLCKQEVQTTQHVLFNTQPPPAEGPLP